MTKLGINCTGVPMGAVYGRLTAIADIGMKGGKRKHRFYKWQCECGRKADIRVASVKNGQTSSCGCFRREHSKQSKRRHGACKTRWYQCWRRMWDRCTNTACPKWKDYGGRGIRVCDRWKVPENFLADMGEPPEGLSIDRIDVNGNYEPANCRWATRKEQSRNQRSNVYIEWRGERMIIAEWADKVGLPYDVVQRRIYRGWPVERALTEPLK